MLNLCCCHDSSCVCISEKELCCEILVRTNICLLETLEQAQSLETFFNITHTEKILFLLQQIDISAAMRIVSIYEKSQHRTLELGQRKDDIY